MKIDELDIQIMEHMQDDARISLRKLGGELDIPHTTICSRVNKLIDRGVIKKFSAILDPNENGLDMSYIIIHTPPSESKKLAKSIEKLDEAQKIFRTLDGKIIVQVVVPNSESHENLEEFLGKVGKYPVTIYPLHEIIKFSQVIHPKILKNSQRIQPKILKKEN
ncbi:MAG: Lrp/AsnC family transcriptional regulator [Candidatus Altiarchaeota archaeon]